MSSELLDSIRSANREFQEFVELLSVNDEQSEDTEKAIGRLTNVHHRLKHISKCLASMPKSSLDPIEGAPEVQRYRENLKVLRSGIEVLQASLLSQKARLNNARSNLQAARSWTASVRLWS